MSILHITKHSHHLLTSVFLRHELIDSITLSHTVSGYKRGHSDANMVWCHRKYEKYKLLCVR